MTKKTGLADSPFFAPVPIKVTETTPLPVVKVEKETSKRKAKKLKNTMTPSNRDTTASRNHATTTPRYHDTTPQIIEVVRKAVKELGKEAATHRFTVTEKKAIADILYTYKTQGVRTSENEIARIAVNFIIEDLRENGENSVLEKVLKALNG